MLCIAGFAALLVAAAEATVSPPPGCPAVTVSATATTVTLSWPPVAGRPRYFVEAYRGKFPDQARLEAPSSDAAAPLLYRLEELQPAQRVRARVCAGAEPTSCPGTGSTACTVDVEATTTPGAPRCETLADTDAAGGTELRGALQSAYAMLLRNASRAECCNACLAVRARLPYSPGCGAATWERATGACYAKRPLKTASGETRPRPGWDTLLVRLEP